MDQICGTPFWNSSVSWEVEAPFVSQCFQHLVLVLGSCGVLWVVAPFEFYKICKARGSPSPWTTLSISKITLKSILLIISLLDLITAIYSYITDRTKGIDELISTTSFFITIVLTIVLTLLCKSRGLRVSLVLPSFWMLSTVTTLICIYNDVYVLDENDWIKMIHLVDDSVSFLISLIQLFLSNMAEKSQPVPRSQEMKDQCPLDGVSLPSRLTFSWLLGLLTKSIQNSLHQDYLLPLCSELRSSYVINSFYDAYSSKKERTFHTRRENLIDEGTIDNENELGTDHVYPKGKSLFLILLKISRKFLVISSISEIVYTSLYFLPAYILSLLLDNDKEDWHNYLFASALFITLLFSAFVDSQRKYYGLMGALRIRTALMNAIFEKALKVSQQSLSETVKSLIITHSDNVFKMIYMMSEVWGSSIRLVVGIYILWSFFGTSCFVGIATAMLFIPVNVIVEHVVSHYQDNALERRNERMSLLTECLEGMKVLKFYAWDNFFLTKLMSIKKSELSELRKAGFLRMTFKFIFLSATSIVMLTALSAHVLMGNSVDIQTIFVSMLLIYLLKPPLRCILHLLAHFIQGLASTSQIQNFLENNEPVSLSNEDFPDENSVLLSNASFSWDGSDIPCLKNLSLKIPRGALVALVGETRSGKTSLLRALLGELQMAEEGVANIKGQLALVGEEAWIQNTTLEKNILFLKPKIEKVYRKVLESCNLHVDIEMLPAGDETEIGEMGVHLTRDQKLKVELARTVYQNADVYLLDNPLRFLETSLAEHIFHRVIGRSGLLKEKTRILVTTEEDFLPLVDFILVFKNGRILERGTYSQLMEKDGHLVEYLKTPHHSPKTEMSPKHTKRYLNTQSFGNQNDIWYSTAVMPSKMKLDLFVTDGSYVSSQGLGHKLMTLLKTLGFVLVTLSMLLAGIACACEAASGVWLSDWTDAYAIGQEHHHNLLIYSGFVLSQVIFTIICGVTLFATSTRAAGKFHTWLLLRLFRASQTVIESTPCKKILQSFNEDFLCLDEKIPEIFYVWLMACLRAPSLLVVIFIVSPYAGILSITLAFAFLVIQKLYLTTWQQLQRLTAATSCPLSNLLDDTLRGASNIRTTQSYSHFLDRFQLKLDTHNNCYLLFLLVSRWMSSSVDIITAFLVLWTTVMGFYERDQGDGFIALAIIFSMQMGETLTNAVFTSSMLNNDLSSFERMMSLSEIKQESEWEDPANSPDPNWPESGSVQVENLCTAYGEGIYPALIAYQALDQVAINGKEESGIFTLLYTFFRLIEPQEGQILIDNLDISKLGLRDLRSRLSVMPEETFVYKGSVRQNLDPNDAYKDEEIWLAVEKAGLKNYISNLDAPMEECRFTEKYLVSLVRCILRKSKVIIVEGFEIYSKTKAFFPESTILLFSDDPLIEFDGRFIKLMSGEVINQEFSADQRNED
ncbi:hypothetical protein JTE90_004443 [Oedothorax gibbosus]|uniref:Uncharacterized protein n=1 Tax=Oedothorax gibbosus TaxID=931172 RepID=A0AAV6UQW6_9ARAC|nr:hypothetical protein JTE90_004443 [Oedothorax gibbosus]